MCQKSNNHNRKKFLRWPALLLAGLCLIGVTACAQSGADSRAEGERRAGEEEAAFFMAQVERNVSGLSEEELRSAAEKYANEVNAVYWLGNELGLCEPFDFSGLQEEWEKDNQERKEKRQAGETVYGPDSLTMEAYFPYRYSALQSDIMRRLLDGRDEALVADARSFYDRHPEFFIRTTAITYQSEIEGEITEHTIPAEQFKLYGQSDPGLMDFLSMAQDGEQTVLDRGAVQETVKRIGVTTEPVDFEENERTVVEMFLNYERLGEWLEQIAQLHKVVF